MLQQNHRDQNKGYDVCWLQRQLGELGYYKGDLDGIFGPLTEEAVRNLQSGVSIKADGVVGAQTYFCLASR